MEVDLIGLASSIAKRHGGSVFMAGADASSSMKVDVIPTGSMGLDKALGTGGWPRGRITEIVGNSQSGKTTLMLHAIAEANKLGLGCLFIDAEYALDLKYASAIGVNMDMIMIAQPDYGEQAMEIAEEAIESKGIGLVVLDSVAALSPKREMEGDMGDAHMGLHARLMNQFVRKMTPIIGKHNVALVLINQYRSSMATFGPTKVTTGGKGIEYFASIIADVSRVQTLKDGDVAVANRTRVEISKNKLSPPKKTAEFDIVYGAGINRQREVIDLADELGVIKKKGSWYADGDLSLQGANKMAQYMFENPVYAENLEARVMEKLWNQG